MATAILKAHDASAFREVLGSLLNYVWPGDNGLPELMRYPGVKIVTTLVITAEAIIAFLLFIPSTARIGLRLTLGTLVAFIGVLTMILFMPNPPSCGCFGGAGTSSSDATTDAVLGIVRNVALVVLILWILKSTRQPSLAPERALQSEQ
ncbi:MAG: hypothetical protein JKX70_11060 [Phycisphaerales bacterium]|nr:hypothetical protein [Phycisphaerales bacterium]